MVLVHAASATDPMANSTNMAASCSFGRCFFLVRSSKRLRPIHGIAPFKGKSRKLSRFETDQILNKVRNLTPKIPPPTDIEVLVLADPPPPFIELSIKYGDSSIQMNWTNDSYNYDEDEPTHPADQLIDLISEVEPFDYEGLGVEQYRLM